MLKIRRKLFY